VVPARESAVLLDDADFSVCVFLPTAYPPLKQLCVVVVTKAVAIVSLATGKGNTPQIGSRTARSALYKENMKFLARGVFTNLYICLTIGDGDGGILSHLS
jgi:hypothetical protein